MIPKILPETHENDDAPGKIGFAQPVDPFVYNMERDKYSVQKTHIPIEDEEVQDADCYRHRDIGQEKGPPENIPHLNILTVQNSGHDNTAPHTEGNVKNHEDQGVFY
jgi:hypothetical protein